MSQSQKENIPELDYHNTCLVDFTNIVKKTNERLIDHCLVYSVTIDYRETSCVRLFYNFLILEIYNILKTSNKKVIFYIDQNSIPTDILKLVRKVLTVLPVRFVTFTQTLRLFKKALEERDSHTLQLLEAAQNENSFKYKQSLRKLYNFIKKEGLIYLNSSFFRDVTNKVLLWNK